MSNYTFHRGPIGYSPTFLFNCEEHIQLYDSDSTETFYALNQQQRIVATIKFSIKDSIATSALNAPFGGIEFNNNIPTKDLFDFITFLQETLRKQEVKKVCIKNAPALYNTHSHTISTAFLLNHQYAIEQAELSSIICIDDLDYTKHIHEWEHRKLKQTKAANISFMQNGLADLPFIYTFIEQCRYEKGYKLSLSSDQVIELAQRLPKKIVCFSLVNQNNLVAACIGILVSDKILYTFYYDHAKQYQSFSPVVMLIEGIYSYCQHNKLTHLDLGTAQLDSKPNFPLLTFKNNLGGIPSLKLTFVKEL